MSSRHIIQQGRKLICMLLAVVMVFTLFPPLGVLAVEDFPEEVAAAATSIGADEKLYRVWFNTPAPNRTPNTTNHPGVHGRDLDWEFRSLPIGNGFMGTTLFGRTDTERISIAESSIYNQASAGLNTFMTLYMDFGHDFAGVTNYFRELILNNAIATVEYTYNGITFTREHIASHPDEITAIRLTARDAVTGAPVPEAIDVTVRPVIPFVRPEGFFWAGVRGRSATVEADVDSGTIRLFGDMENFGLHYEGQIRVIPTGGTMSQHDWRFNPEYLSSIEGVGTRLAPNMYGGVLRGRGEAYDAEGLRVEGASEVLILIGGGTNYRLAMETDWSAVFSAGAEGWGFPANANRLARDPNLEARVTGLVDAAESRGWDSLVARHVADHRYFFDRARLDLGGTAEDAFNMTTEARIQRYRSSPGISVFDPYLEELFWQFGRYLLIASSREGGLGAHLQGIWTAYEHTPWSGGWWHNINLQMNYWPAFNTNLADLFQAYANFSEAFRPAAQRGADLYLAGNAGTTAAPGLDPRLTGPVGRNLAPAGTGGNGWIVGTGVWPYHVSTPTFTDHSGPGTGGMTTSLFWEYWDFTRDLNILENVTWPAIEGMAQFLMRTLRWCAEEELYLVWFSASPELLWRNPVTGVRQYYRTIGSLFDQQMVYDVYYTTIRAAHILREANINPTGHPIDWAFIEQIEREIDYLAPVIVGRSGQVKEYREEEFYGEITDEHRHRHISHLLGLYPGTVFNSTTPHWLDAARTTLHYRGDGVTGWSQMHTLHFRARMGEGDHAYRIFRNLMRQHVRYNMWAQHEPFQIDGNFGGTSGMAEMLLQSHEGYISLLPARPSTWATGSFTGLTARGGFEVDARWRNGQAEQFTIWSGAGEPAYVRFPYIGTSGVTVRDSFGRNVPFTVVTGIPGVDGATDVIRFDTQVGLAYTITGIPPFTVTAPASDLEITTGVFPFGDTEAPGVDLRWTASPDAASYRVYVARDSAPDYTYLGTVTGTNFLHGPLLDTKGSQFTYRIMAIGANGRASVGVTDVIIPARPPGETTGSFIEDNGVSVLGVYVGPEVRTLPRHPDVPTATPTAIPQASVYLLYELVGTELVLRAESIFPIIYLEHANPNGIFYVGTYDPVTGGTEVRVRVDIVDESEPTIIENVFLNRPIRVTSPFTTYALNTPAALVNGDRTTRFAVMDNVTAGGQLQVEIDLGGETTISELRFVQYASRSAQTTFEVFRGGVWHEVFHRTTPLGPGGQANVYAITFPGPEFPSGSMVRLTFQATGLAVPTFFALEASSGPLTMVNKTALIAAIQDAQAIARQLGFGIYMDAATRTTFTNALDMAFLMLGARTATQAAVNATVQTLRDAMLPLPEASRVALANLISSGESALAGIDAGHPLYAALNAALTQAGLIDLTNAPMTQVNPALYALNQVLRQLALLGVEDLELTITHPTGGIFTTPPTVELTNGNPNITRFYFTLDGTVPSPTNNDGFVVRPDMTLPVLRHGLHELSVAGFRAGESTPATNVVSGVQFLVVETENFARRPGATADAAGSHYPPAFGIGNLINGNLNARWAGPGGWASVNMGSEVTVSAIVLHSFVEAHEVQARLQAFTIQYYDDGWQTFYTGNGRQQPVNGLNLHSQSARPAPQRVAYGTLLAAPVTAQQFRIEFAGVDSFWELEFFGEPAFHNVTFDLAGGTWIGGGDLEQSVITGGAAAAPIAERANYVFAGWNVPLTNITGPRTITAQWTPIFAPEITTIQADIPAVTIGESFRIQLEASGTTPIQWFLYEGALPAGLTLTRQGWISGTPTVYGAFPFTVRAISAYGYDEVEFTITVAPLADFDALLAAIEAAEALSADDYTQASWAVLESALAAAILMSENENASHAQVVAVMEDLATAIDGLISLVALREVIADGTGRAQARYTPSTWEALQAILTQAKLVLADPDASAEDVADATAGVQAAIEALVQRTGDGGIITPQPEYEYVDAFMFGDDRGNFRPRANMMRAEVAAVLVRLHVDDFEADTYPAGMTDFAVFSDVTSANWFYYYVAWAYDAGLIQGRGDGTFAPTSFISREEFAAMGARLGTVLPAGELPFDDAESISNWALGYVYTAVDSGWMLGDPNGNFRPQANIMRAEVATAVNRSDNRVDSNEALEVANVANPEAIRDFPDVAEDSWYFASVVGATNDHRVRRDDDGAIISKVILD